MKSIKGGWARAKSLLLLFGGTPQAAPVPGDGGGYPPDYVPPVWRVWVARSRWRMRARARAAWQPRAIVFASTSRSRIAGRSAVVMTRSITTRAVSAEATIPLVTGRSKSLRVMPSASRTVKSPAAVLTSAWGGMTEGIRHIVAAVHVAPSVIRAHAISKRRWHSPREDEELALLLMTLEE